MTQSDIFKREPAAVRFEVRHGGRSVRCTYQQVFASGYDFWVAKKYFEAAKVFESLSIITDRGPRAHIMLSHCKAMLGDYGGCSQILSRVLPQNDFDKLATELHNAFVMWKCAFYLDAKLELENVVANQIELPTPCLLLADLLAEAGNNDKSNRLLKLAIQRDRPDGAVAAIARNKLTAEKSRKNASP